MDECERESKDRTRMLIAMVVMMVMITMMGQIMVLLQDLPFLDRFSRSRLEK